MDLAWYNRSFFVEAANGMKCAPAGSLQRFSHLLMTRVLCFIAFSSPAHALEHCNSWTDEPTSESISTLSELFLYEEGINSAQESQTILENALVENGDLINEPVYRLLLSYSYALKNNFLGTMVHAEFAERLALDRQDCDLVSIIDVSQSLRIAATLRHFPKDDRDGKLFSGWISILPDSEENRLLDSHDVICGAFKRIIYENSISKKLHKDECEIRSIAR